MSAVVAESPLGSWYLRLDAGVADPPTLQEEHLRTGYSFLVSFLVEHISIRAIPTPAGRLVNVHATGRRFLASGALGSTEGWRSYPLHQAPVELEAAIAHLLSITKEVAR